MTIVEATSTYAIHLAVRPDGNMAPVENGLRVDVGSWQQTIPVANAAVRDAFAQLAVEPVTSPQLMQRALAAGGDMAIAMELKMAQARLEAIGLLEYRVVDPDGQAIAALRSAGALAASVRPVPDDRLQRSMSPHLVATPAAGQVLVESGASHLQVRLTADIFGELVAGRGELLPRAVLDLLHSAGLWLTEEQITSREYRQWDACDLWFHRKVSDFRRGPGYGGTFRLAGEFEPIPFDRPIPPDATVIDLPVADLNREDEPTLAQAMERRRSTRAFAPGATTLEQVAGVLYRTMRTRGTTESERGLEVVDRPYPSGGAIHELDAYVLAADVNGLQRGLYRYDSRNHQLVLVTDHERRVAAISAEAQMNAAADGPAPVVVLLSARFGRLMWKYEGMAYALLTKHVGVVYQSMYLAAQAEGLGLCGLGGCSSMTFAAATGVNPMAEDVVGHLIMGAPDPGLAKGRQS
ncbi:SagB family peptide dehydrogenase [Demetria terragena]|uniref:SagB family peptide dehydrogenase n=1 Tax=Demetria terragena TaxID=63959 RepID=UPI000376053F|nr:SagB family peptide dehydrogenase [Demetria terragena]